MLTVYTALNWGRKAIALFTDRRSHLKVGGSWYQNGRRQVHFFLRRNFILCPFSSSSSHKMCYYRESGEKNTITVSLLLPFSVYIAQGYASPFLVKSVAFLSVNLKCWESSFQFPTEQENSSGPNSTFTHSLKKQEWIFKKIECFCSFCSHTRVSHYLFILPMNLVSEVGQHRQK